MRRLRMASNIFLVEGLIRNPLGDPNHQARVGGFLCRKIRLNSVSTCYSQKATKSLPILPMFKKFVWKLWSSPLGPGKPKIWVTVYDTAGVGCVCWRYGHMDSLLGHQVLSSWESASLLANTKSGMYLAHNALRILGIWHEIWGNIQQVVWLAEIEHNRDAKTY
jgi:hypothetical protein